MGDDPILGAALTTAPGRLDSPLAAAETHPAREIWFRIAVREIGLDDVNGARARRLESGVIKWTHMLPGGTGGETSPPKGEEDLPTCG